MGKPSKIQIPGAPAAPTTEDGATPAANAGGAAAAEGDEGSDPQADRIAELEAANRRLTAQVAAHVAAGQPGESLVFEADTPHGRTAKAQSKHLHLTSAELHEKVKAGEVKLTDHHVLCKDGWYVNPAAQAQANG